MKDNAILLRKKIEEYFNGEPWYGDSVKSVFKDITPRMAIKKNKNVHSIADLVMHMISYRRFLLNALTTNDSFNINQEETFDWKKVDKNEKTAWESLLKTLEENQQAILKELEKTDDNFLKSPVYGKPYSIEYLVEGIVQHDIYHLGQISLLKKM